HAAERLEEGARHATRADHADRVSVGPRQMLDAESGAAADAEMLQHAVVDEGKRLAVAGRDQEYQPAIGAGLAAVLVLAPVAGGIARPGNNVGLHADGEKAVVRALH